MSSIGNSELVAASKGGGLARRPWWRRSPAILLAVLAVGAAMSIVRPGARTPSRLVLENGVREAPDLVLPDILDTGSIVRLSDHKGTPVVLNFWASWCVPCRKEMPALARASAEFAGEVDFLGVDYQDVRDDGLALLREARVRYPSGFDPEGSAASSFGLRGMPTTVFISANGQVMATSLGELTESELRSSIVELFGIADD